MASVTFHPCCVASNRRKDGTYPVKIRVTFRGVSRRLPTTLVARPGDLTRSLHIKSPDIMSRANALIAQMQATLADLSPFVLEAWDVDRVVAHIRTALGGQAFRLDYFEWADRFLGGKGDSNRRTYASALGALERFVGRRELDINDITRPLLMEFMDAVGKEGKMQWRKGGTMKDTGKPKSAASASRYIMKLAHIFEAAKERYNDEDGGVILIPRSPFATIPRDYGISKGPDALDIETMQRIIDAQADGVVREALDAFLLSFALMGANLADIYAEPEGVGAVWTYHRQKVRDRRPDGAEMRVDILPQAAALIARLQDGPAGWWIPALHRIAYRKDLCTQKLNAALKLWAEREGVEPFTFGAARHTWGTLARNRARIDKATVDECMVHVGDLRVADIYIERDWAVLNDANRKTLDLLRWPTSPSGSR